jgi:hypothetical protein
LAAAPVSDRVKLAFPVASPAGFLVNNQQLNSGGTTDFAFVPSLGRTRFILIHLWQGKEDVMADQTQIVFTVGAGPRLSEMTLQDFSFSTASDTSLPADIVLIEYLQDKNASQPGPVFVP